MKAARGFTLVELLVVMTIMATLLAIATLNWNRMVMKNTIEGQIKVVHADMMGTRLEALYSKQPRSVTFSGKTFKVYSSLNTGSTVAPISTRTFKYNFVPTGTTKVSFDTSGMANANQITICVDPFADLTETNDAAVDSVVISQARINLGKRDGGNCVGTGVIQK